MTQAENIIRHFNLLKHPEGGYYRETYRSKEFIESSQLNEFSGERNYSTCIYFLLTSDEFSAFHKIKQDEIWHYYQGSPIRLHLISPKGVQSQFDLGIDYNSNQQPQIVIPANHWFAAEVLNFDDYSLVGCTVAPGFDFDDFELAKRKKLQQLFPMHKDLIQKFTR